MSIMKNIEVSRNLSNDLKPFRVTVTFEHEMIGIENVYGLDGNSCAIPKQFIAPSTRDYEFGTRKELEDFLRQMITD